MSGKSFSTRSGVRGPDAALIRAQQANYGFLQLLEWRNRANELFSIRGVLFTDVDEVHNRVVIGVEDLAARARVESALAAAGIPRAAV